MYGCMVVQYWFWLKGIMVIKASFKVLPVETNLGRMSLCDSKIVKLGLLYAYIFKQEIQTNITKYMLG